MEAFDYAVGLGYRYVETDVQVTADGVLVAFHDNDLQRTCGVKGRISARGHSRSPSSQPAACSMKFAPPISAPHRLICDSYTDCASGLFEAVAERTTSNVVCATGTYRWVPPYFFLWDADEIAERPERHVPDVDAPDRHAAAVDVVEPGGQIAERRLSRSRLADDRRRRAGPHRERDVGEHRRLRSRVVEADAAQLEDLLSFLGTLRGAASGAK